MIANLRWLMPLVVVGFPLTASAQVSDATYCRRLTARYEAFIENMSGHSMQPGGLDGQVAIANVGSIGATFPLAAPINALPRVCNSVAGQLASGSIGAGANAGIFREVIEKRRSVSLPSESWRRPCAFDSPRQGTS